MHESHDDLDYWLIYEVILNCRAEEAMTSPQDPVTFGQKFKPVPEKKRKSLWLQKTKSDLHERSLQRLRWVHPRTAANNTTLRNMVRESSADPSS